METKKITLTKDCPKRFSIACWWRDREDVQNMEDALKKDGVHILGYGCMEFHNSEDETEYLVIFECIATIGYYERLKWFIGEVSHEVKLNGTDFLVPKEVEEVEA